MISSDVRRFVLFFMICSMTLVLPGCKLMSGDSDSDDYLMLRAAQDLADEGRSYVLTKMETFNLCAYVEPPVHYLSEDSAYEYYQDDTLKEEIHTIYDFDNPANNQSYKIGYTYENGRRYTKTFDENCDGYDHILISAYDTVTGFLSKQEFSDIDRTWTLTTDFECNSSGNIIKMSVQLDEENEDEKIVVESTYEDGNLVKEDIKYFESTYTNQYDYTDGNLTHESVELNYKVLLNNPDPNLYYFGSFITFISTHDYKDGKKIRTEIDYYSDSEDGGPDGNTDLVVFSYYDDNGNLETEKYYVVTGNDYEIDPDTDTAVLYTDYKWELR